MNFLAHLFLSGPPGEIMLGNFMADSVTAAMKPAYSGEIQKGLRLHHAIDAFTDKHPVVQQSKERLREPYHKYAPVIVDIFYDHFLAAEWSRFSNTSLRDFADAAYSFLGSQSALLPERSMHFYRYMHTTDALYNYSQISGIRRVMKGMASRASIGSGMEDSPDALVMHYDAFKEEFLTFFPELMEMSASFLREEMGR
ncbi:MAG TPA: ACP phosphodiesterase [Bacteroidia bacterium]|jgi:acyl carrier protein phosphodiesterase|nr:ACP phosphodiesterase [Bacteroidia bacterium]